MDYQKWLGKTIEYLQEDGKFVNFFAFAKPNLTENSYYLTNELLGIEVVFDKNQELNTVFFNSENYHGFSEFKGLLPLNLNFSLNGSDRTVAWATSSSRL